MPTPTQNGGDTLVRLQAAGAPPVSLRVKELKAAVLSAAREKPGGEAMTSEAACTSRSSAETNDRHWSTWGRRTDSSPRGWVNNVLEAQLASAVRNQRAGGASSTGYVSRGYAVDVLLPRVVASGREVAPGRSGAEALAVPEPRDVSEGKNQVVHHVSSLDSCVPRVDPGGEAIPAPPHDDGNVVATRLAAPPNVTTPVAKPFIVAQSAVVPSVSAPSAAVSLVAAAAVIAPPVIGPLVVAESTPQVVGVARRAYVDLDLRRVWPIP